MYSIDLTFFLVTQPGFAFNDCSNIAMIVKEYHFPTNRLSLSLSLFLIINNINKVLRKCAILFVDKQINNFYRINVINLLGNPSNFCTHYYIASCFLKSFIFYTSLEKVKSNGIIS